jgi:hypothetical protein
MQARGVLRRRGCHRATVVRPYPSGAPEGDANSAPVSTAERSRHRSRHAVTTRRETASPSAAAPPCQPHISTRTSMSSTREAPRSSPCASHSSRNASTSFGGSHRGKQAQSRPPAYVNVRSGLHTPVGRHGQALPSPTAGSCKSTWYLRARGKRRSEGRFGMSMDA